MKLLAALLAAATLVVAVPEPSVIDAARTTVQLDTSRSVLDNGGVQLSIHRVDDLFDDESHQLIAERLSHIAVRIQLDSNALRVNDEVIDLANQDTVAVAIVKSDALLLPAEMPSSIVSEQEMAIALSNMSPGIVSLEVRVESEEVNAEGVVGSNGEGEMRAMVVDGLRLRRVGVFIKINEIEGVNMEHSSLVYAPILQLLVASETENGAVSKITTLSIGGQAPTEDAPVLPGIAMVHDMLPEVETDAEAPAAEYANPPEDYPHFGHSRPSGFLGWLASMFGPSDRRHRAGRPCPGKGKFRLGHAAAGMHKTEGEDDMASAVDAAVREAYPEMDGAAPGRGHHGHHHGGHRHRLHHRKGKVGCAMRRFGHFLAAFFPLFFSLAMGGLVFSFVRRCLIKRSRAARYQAVETEDLVARDSEVEKKVLDDAVYVEALPEYESVVVVVEAPRTDEKQ